MTGTREYWRFASVIASGINIAMFRSPQRWRWSEPLILGITGKKTSNGNIDHPLKCAAGITRPF
jgi:hypothetical protein